MSSAEERKQGAIAPTAVAAETPAWTVCAPTRVAPPQLFTSPFLPQHERAISILLKYLHPNLRISRTAMTILQRFSDRLAHYLIHRACFGLNSGMHSRLEALSSSTQPSSGSSSLHAAASSSSAPPSLALFSSDDPHSIHFAFDEPMWTAVGELRDCAHREAVKTRTTLSEVGEAGLAALTAAHAVDFTFPIALADRWLQDFTMGLRLVDDAAELLPPLHSLGQRVVLCALVEHLTTHWLDFAGDEAKRNQPLHILSSHLWIAMENHTEMQPLGSFLPVDWRINTKGIESPLELACASKPLDAVRHPWRFLEFALAPHAAAQAELNPGSWHHDPAALRESARAIAQSWGAHALMESQLSYELREAHVRPLRFWGVDATIPWPLYLICTAAGFGSDLAQLSRESAYVSFLLTDANGREFELLLRGQCGDPPSALCFAWCPDGVLHLVASIRGHQLKPVPSNAALSESTVSLTVTVDPSALASEYYPHGLSLQVPTLLSFANQNAAGVTEQVPKDSMSIVSQWVSAAASWSSLGDATSAVFCSTAAGAVMAAATASSRRGASSSEELAEERRRAVARAAATSAKMAAITTARVSTELERAVRAALPLLKFSLVGPTMFVANQPPAMRRLFTAHFINKCLRDAGLRWLPRILLETIADYHSFDLPFRDDRVKDHLSEAGFKPRGSSGSQKAVYEGQMDSAVERVCNVEAEIDRRFPVPVPEENEPKAETKADEGRRCSRRG